MSVTTNNPWLNCSRLVPDSIWNIISFHGAGGSAENFLSWQPFLQDASLYPIQLPGRSARRHETPITNLQELLPILMQLLSPIISDKPYVLFGHSMGTMLAYWVARRAQELQLRLPTLLVISAGALPQKNNLPIKRPQNSFGYSESIKELIRLSKTNIPLAHIETLQQLIHDDLALYHSGLVDDDFTFNCPMLVFGATHDHLIPTDEIKKWETKTNMHYIYREIPGDHFYLRTHKEQVISIIIEETRKIHHASAKSI